MAGKKTNPDAEEAKWLKHEAPPQTTLTPKQEKDALARLGEHAQGVLDAATVEGTPPDIERKRR